MTKEKIPVLFCQENSIYKKMRGRNRVPLCDAWDKERNALTWQGGPAAIHHPPCPQWSRLRNFARVDHLEKYCAVWSVSVVRRDGGILEHPGDSYLWPVMNLPKPGQSDEYGFTIEVDQFHFGHKARKRTWLYIVGLPAGASALQFRRIPGVPKYAISSARNDIGDLTKAERDATPKKFAKWLVKMCAEINNLKTKKNAT